ncbi:restriction endonuclease subunit S [Haemophilus influenzae]|uniref:restriction endonuclease subunit S n=1 Tax=Haemophilus influenzae TaxID=727 RepID=UPI000D493F13|nr:restriction endonuclease subunit S [Haemophilus influenzae]PRJ53946.1 Restriction enzyme BgcI subunit beta [Haemophilus influenzae]PRJ56228.1 Restriction enzyme BgcI subunit beta [Haemophilus influenzae]
MSSGGFFKDVLIEDVLEWQKNIFELNPLHLNKLTVEGNNKFPFYGQSVMNNGIISYECLQERVLNNKNSKPTILIHSNNQNLVYLETPFYLKDGHGATSVLQANCLTKNSALYLISIISKVIKEKFNYDFKATKIALKNTKIFVPYINQEPAFSYMEDFITELQAERLQELQGYLQVTGLSNYTLTEEEQRAIEGLKSTVEQEMFTMQDIFRITTSAKKFNAKDLSFDGIYPYVVRTEKDNGIRGYITEDKKYLNPENTISFGQDTATMFYQKNAYFTGDKIKIFSLKNKILNRSIALYLITRMKKSFSVFSWGSMFNEEVLNKTEIYLPINNGQIDYSKMELITSAVQKLVIADVVKYADRELSAYQSVIGK